MPKLLSEKEAVKIATKMAEEYGLAARIGIDNYSGSVDSNLKGEIGRIRKMPHEWLPWFKKDQFITIRNFYAENFEDALSKLQSELSKYDSRAKIAEQLRHKYTMQEADEVLDEVLRETSSS